MIKSGFSEKAGRCLQVKMNVVWMSPENWLIDHSPKGDRTQVLCRLQVNVHILYNPIQVWKRNMETVGSVIRNCMLSTDKAKVVSCSFLL